MALFKGTKEPDTPTVEGESAAECMKVGQEMVDGGQLTAENLATVLSAANGDLLTMTSYMISKFSVGRAELAAAVSLATGVPIADTKAIRIPEELLRLLDEAIVREHCALAVAEEGSTLVVLC